jgi:hypothetical protein
VLGNSPGVSLNVVAIAPVAETTVRQVDAISERVSLFDAFVLIALVDRLSI